MPPFCLFWQRPWPTSFRVRVPSGPQQRAVRTSIRSHQQEVRMRPSVSQTLTRITGAANLREARMKTPYAFASRVTTVQPVVIPTMTWLLSYLIRLSMLVVRPKMLHSHSSSQTDQDQDQDPAHRNLQEKIADWACLIPGDSNLKGTVKINWGYQQGDATWACNAWRPACGKKCTALPIKESTWDCYNRDPMLHRGTVTVWWGHQPSDGAWACNQWKTDCKGGKCYVREVKNVVDSTNNRRWDYPPPMHAPEMEGRAGQSS
jgi:hypothetical protein